MGGNAGEVEGLAALGLEAAIETSPRPASTDAAALRAKGLASAATTASAGFDFSVMMVCLLGDFSLCCALRSSFWRARSACHSAHRSAMEDTNRKRGFKNVTAHANENVVASRSEMRSPAVRITTEPAGFSDASNLSAIRLPNAPPAGMWSRIRGNDGEIEKAVEMLRTIRIIPDSRIPKYATRHDASQ